MTTTTTSPRDAATAFAHAVRQHLDDLPAEQIDELTEGLEADLLERAAETTDSDAFGDAHGYANELRDAAGLPPRGRRAGARTLSARLVVWRAELERSIRSNRIGAGLLDFALALRPLWWVLRGWLLFTIVAKPTSHYYGFVPDDLPRQVILAAVVVVSIQWGRGRWLPKRSTVLRTISNVIAVFAAVIVTAAALAGSFTQPTPSVDELPHNYGLWYDGNQVSNIFAYDAAGQPLQFVQLYTDTGEPLTTMGARADELWDARYLSDGSRLVPPASEHGSTAWNVFPLHTLPPQFGLGEGHEQQPRLPFDQARPLIGGDALVQTCEVPPAE